MAEARLLHATQVIKPGTPLNTLPVPQIERGSPRCMAWMVRGKRGLPFRWGSWFRTPLSGAALRRSRRQRFAGWFTALKRSSVSAGLSGASFTEFASKNSRAACIINLCSGDRL